MHLMTCHEILVLELIGDSCSRQRVGCVRYLFKLLVRYYLEIFVGKKNDEYALNKIWGEIFHGSAVIRLIGSFILAHQMLLTNIL